MNLQLFIFIYTHCISRHTTQFGPIQSQFQYQSPSLQSCWALSAEIEARQSPQLARFGIV